MNSQRCFGVVTGAGSGIGRAVAIELSKEPVTVLAVGRRHSALEKTAELASGDVMTLSADVSTDAGRSAIFAALGEDSVVNYLVHGAGVLPIQKLGDITSRTWREIMATNVDARLFLTQSLISKLAGDGRVLFIGSMSATKARKGSAGYCTSLAASFMLHQCLKLELAEHDIYVANAIPGPVNTRILRDSMAADPDVFPDSAEYYALRKAGRLIEPATVGRFYRWLLTQTDNETYSTASWDIRDETHHRAWLGDADLYGHG
ncbi:MAG: SDR family oxidoreductase [Acidiferrobacterales bacterium]